MRTRYYDLASEKRDPKITFQGYASLYLEKNEIEQQLEKYQNQITEEANEYLNNLNAYQEVITKDVNNILKEYEVNINA